MTVNDFKNFIEWKDNQDKDYLCGEFRYNIKGHYKYLNEKELLDYWLKYIYKSKH